MLNHVANGVAVVGLSGTRQRPRINAMLTSSIQELLSHPTPLHPPNLMLHQGKPHLFQWQRLLCRIHIHQPSLALLAAAHDLERRAVDQSAVRVLEHSCSKEAHHAGNMGTAAQRKPHQHGSPISAGRPAAASGSRHLRRPVPMAPQQGASSWYGYAALIRLWLHTDTSGGMAA